MLSPHDAVGESDGVVESVSDCVKPIHDKDSVRLTVPERVKPRWVRDFPRSDNEMLLDRVRLPEPESKAE